MKKLVVLPNDPIYKYYEKGEIKPRYYNPCNYFDEVHLLSLSHTEIEPGKVQTLAGDARLCIHALGKPSPLNFPLFFPKVLKKVRQIAPDVIRAFNPRQCGALAVYAGKKLGIPTSLSIHLEYDDQRRHDPRLLLKLVKSLEYNSLRHVDVAICVTDYLRQYAQKYGAKRCETIYNKVYLNQFASLLERPERDTVTILSVGRLDRQKYQECLIRAIKHLNVKLILIGQGELEDSLKALANQLGIAEKVKFIPSVPNADIQQQYWNADIFALATHYEGFCIPILEAMAAGLPVVASAVPPIPEVLGDTGRLVENTPEAFEAAFRELLQNHELRRTLGQRAEERARQLDGAVMEEKERALYESLIQAKEELR